jgi:glycosyltransferase involved in cell wall biosynthesis
MPVRLLLLAHGPSVHTRRWAAALHARGHAIRLLSAHAAPEGPVPARVVGWPLPARALRYASARGAVRAEARAFRPDVTVAHFLPNYGFLAAIAGLRPLFLACWGSDLLINATRTPLHRARARYTLRRADLVHVDARVLADAAIRLGAPPDRVWTRPWGVDTDGLRPGRPWAERRRAAGAPLRILWTRALEPLYDPETLLRALALLDGRGVAFAATLAGDGPLRSALEALARGLGIGDRVRFEGMVGEPRLRELLHGHEVYVSLSRSDSTSQSLLEAMAAGQVPVVTDIAGNREWIVHRACGLLVPVGDPEALAAALSELAEAPDEAAPLAEAARTVADRRARFADTIDELERRLGVLAAQGGGGPR